MEMSNIHPKLIRANVALYNGERSETRRLLKEDVEGQGRENVDPEVRSLILWLDAQAQHRRADRIERLRKLLEFNVQDTTYHQMARQYLQQEDVYQVDERPEEDIPRLGATIFGVPRGRALGFAGAGGLIVLLLLVGFNVGLGAFTDNSDAPAVVATQAAIVEQATVAADLPDNSVLVQRGTRLAQYPQGRLEVVAIENSSQRVIETTRNTLVQPIQGARYFALRVIFSCEVAICSQPPQANISLLLANGEAIGLLGNAAIAGQNSLQPVAQGRETDGWIVFQIPDNSQPSALQILPVAQGQGETPVPVLIELPTTG